LSSKSQIRHSSHEAIVPEGGTIRKTKMIEKVNQESGGTVYGIWGDSLATRLSKRKKVMVVSPTKAWQAIGEGGKIGVNCKVGKKKKKSRAVNISVKIYPR